MMPEERGPGKAEALTRRETAQLVVSGTLLECGLGLIAVVAGWILGLPLWQVVSWEVGAFIFGTLAVLPMLLVFLMVEWLPLRAFGEFRRLMKQVLAPLLRSATIPEVAMISIVAGLAEEAFFRGIVQRGIMHLLGKTEFSGQMEWETTVAILAASVLFGLAHPLSRLYIILTTGIGSYLGVLFLVSGNLLVPMVAHAVYDFIAILYLTRWVAREKQTG